MIKVFERDGKKKIVIYTGITGILLCFFFLYSFLAFQETALQPIKFNSPDETANYYFSKIFAERTEIGYSEPLLKDTKGLLHPRSMAASSDGGRVVSAGFLGIVFLYGVLGKFFSSGAIPFFTPVIAVVSSVFFYFLLTEFFSKRVALLSSLLLLIHPAYWYYSNRGMFPNVLFLDLLIGGLFFLWRAFHFRTNLIFFISGFFVGLALIVRLSELPWVLFLLLFIWMCTIRRFRVRGTCFFLFGITIPLVILFWCNQQVYGNMFFSGYTQIGTHLSAGAMQTNGMQWWQNIYFSVKFVLKSFLNTLFPFGFVFVEFKKNFLTYFVSLFWWFTVPAVVGIGSLLFHVVRQIRHHIYSKELGYLCVFFATSLWLIPFYGSWAVMDTITGEATIGNSYVRYWLPLYCFIIPLSAYGICYVYDHIRSFFGKKSIAVVLFFIFVFFSYQSVFSQKTDGLISVAKHIQEYRDISLRVTNATEEGAVIFSNRSDKIFFPQRHSAQSFNGFGEVEIIPSLLKKAPVYYYGFEDQVAGAEISEKYFSPFGLRLEHISDIAGVESLYRVVR